MEVSTDFIRGYELDGGNITTLFGWGLVLGLVAAGVGFYYLIRYYPAGLKVFLLWLLSFVFLWVACLSYINIIKEEMANLEAARQAVDALSFSELQKYNLIYSLKREPISKGPVYFWGGAGLVCFITGFVLMPTNEKKSEQPSRTRGSGHPDKPVYKSAEPPPVESKEEKQRREDEDRAMKFLDDDLR